MNWGHGITIGFGLFVAYILYFVFTSFGESIDLVSEDYYAQEVAYQSRIEQKRNAAAVKDEVQVTRKGDEVVLSFPEEWRHAITHGEVHFFRPSNKALDVKVPLQLDDHSSLHVPADKLVSGRYQVKIYWEADQKAFYIEKDLHI